MWDFLGIRHYFQQVAEDRAARQARDQKFTEAMAAMGAGEAAKVREIAANNSFSYRQTTAMMVKAINTDNVEMFDAVLEGKGFHGDMNEMLYFRSPLMPEGPHHYSEVSMLYQAISNGKTKIAVSLANNPETDITKSGYSETSVYRSGGFGSNGHLDRKRDDYRSPLELARELNMAEVIVPLARRTAELKRGEAAALISEAQALSPA